MRAIFFFFSISILLLCRSGNSQAQVTLERKPAGSPPIDYSAANFPACRPVAASDFRVKHYVPGMISGYFHFVWTLFKNGQSYQTDTQTYDLRGNSALGYQNYTYVKNFLNIPSDNGVYMGRLEIQERAGPFWNYHYNGIYSGDSPTLTISDVTPTHAIKIRDTNGVFVSPPTDGSAIQVSLGGGIIVDASGSTCETGYLISVQESNVSWIRSNLNEMDKWFTGQAPANINLQQTVTTYSPSDGTGYFSLLGGFFSSGPLAGQARYYRVGIQAAGAPWNPKYGLIQVNW
jgi:hypothetical protein